MRELHLVAAGTQQKECQVHSSNVLNEWFFFHILDVMLISKTKTVPCSHIDKPLNKKKVRNLAVDEVYLETLRKIFKTLHKLMPHMLSFWRIHAFKFTNGLRPYYLSTKRNKKITSSLIHTRKLHISMIWFKKILTSDTLAGFTRYCCPVTLNKRCYRQNGNNS